ncbi:Methyltransferase-like protein 23 [Geranomyces michiganensis]|nr:Methyltransferase-like protein 23 [Geranomyces michiganensis]
MSEPACRDSDTDENDDDQIDNDGDDESYIDEEDSDHDHETIGTVSTTRRIAFPRPHVMTGLHAAVPLIHITLHELLDQAYGAYLWPSALVLAAWVAHNARLLTSARVLELGCGTALPGLVAAQCGAARVVLTDTATVPEVLANASRSVQANGLSAACIVTPLEWGDFDAAAAAVLDAGYDFILGADVFYEPSMFESTLVTVARCLRKSTTNAVFVTAYQERSCRRSIAHLLARYGLVAQLVNKQDFGGWGEGWRMDGELPSGISSVVLLIIRQKV